METSCKCFEFGLQLLVLFIKPSFFLDGAPTLNFKLDWILNNRNELHRSLLFPVCAAFFLPSYIYKYLHMSTYTNTLAFFRL